MVKKKKEKLINYQSNSRYHIPVDFFLPYLYIVGHTSDRTEDLRLNCCYKNFFLS